MWCAGDGGGSRVCDCVDTWVANEQGDCLSNADVDLRIRSCSQLIQREPNNATAYNSRAAAYATKGDYTSAVAVADAVKAGELAPKKDPQAIAERPVSRLKAPITPPKKSAPAIWEGPLPAWAQTLFGKSAQE